MSHDLRWKIHVTQGDTAFEEYLVRREPATTVMSEKYHTGYLDRRLKKGGRFYICENRAAIYHGPGGLFYPNDIRPNAPDEESLRRFFGTFIQLYSIMGQRDDVHALTRCFTGTPGISVDYYLLRRKNTVDITIPPAPHREIDIRVPELSTWKKLLPLQIAYEVEEVLLPGRRANPAASKASLTESLKHQLVLVAYYHGEAIGRVATNARGYVFAQIGGVYTDPAWRRKGLARWLMSHLIARLEDSGYGVSLFVKPNNVAALRLYERLGFSFESDFRISYYI